MASILSAGLIGMWNAIQTAYSKSIAGNSGGNAGTAFRIICTPSVGGSQIRITVRSGTSGGLSIDHVSVGTQSATYVTTATPVEVTFGGGGHGTTAASGSNDSVSDWIPFKTTAGTPIVIDCDVNSAFTNIGAILGTSGEAYFLASTAQYNIASPAGTWTHDTANTYLISKIEVRQ